MPESEIPLLPSSTSANVVHKIDWKHITSEDDLRKLKNISGSFLAIKEQLSNDLGLDVPARGYSELFKYIQNFQYLFKEEAHQDVQITGDRLEQPHIATDTHEDAYFFASEQHRLTYALIRLEGSQRMDMLGITDEHWRNKNLVQKWFRDLSKKIHPDHNKVAKADLAWQKLEKIKDDLMKHAEKFGKHVRK
jgi:hypothetical protein